MYKLIFLIGCLAILAGQAYSQDLLNILAGQSCRNYNAMPNFDLKKVSLLSDYHSRVLLFINYLIQGFRNLV